MSRRLTNTAMIQMLQNNPSSELFHRLWFKELHNSDGQLSLEPGVAEVQAILIRNENCPLEILEDASMKKLGMPLMWAFSKNTNIPSEILHRILTANRPRGLPSFIEYMSFAKHPNLSSETILNLVVASQGKNGSGYESTLARHPNCSVEALTILAKSSDKSIKRAVAKNPLTPEDVLLELAKDENKLIRKLALLNQNMPPEVLKLRKMLRAPELAGLVYKPRKNKAS